LISKENYYLMDCLCFPDAVTLRKEYLKNMSSGHAYLAEKTVDYVVYNLSNQTKSKEHDMTPVFAVMEYNEYISKDNLMMGRVAQMSTDLHVDAIRDTLKKIGKPCDC
jgi:hypothetical protein